MTKRLDGTVALVTGASSGIGEATARALVAEGATVAVAARRKDRLDHLVASTSSKVLAIQADLSDLAQAEGAVERTVAEFGRLDTLVNNAGVMFLGAVADAPVTEWDQMIALNVRTLITTTRAALPHLLKAAEDSPRGIADIVNVSSTAGRVARNGTAVYSLTKFGIGAFSESLRQELAQRDVRVSLIEPGRTATELMSHNRDEVLKDFDARFSTADVLAADDVADTICYIVTRNRGVAINEILVRPTGQQY
jgi:NADP-dependent 3-hydroxy acid dehydrogenase YdfG